MKDYSVLIRELMLMTVLLIELLRYDIDSTSCLLSQTSRCMDLKLYSFDVKISAALFYEAIHLE